MVSMDDVSRLAELLRDKGDRILNNECKLTLSTDLLDKLNDDFNLIVEHKDSLTTSFHVLSNTNLSSTICRDLLFLYDFVQKSKSLKLALGNPRDDQSDNIDVSKFKELRLFELHKINVNNVTGINMLRLKLQHLVCERSINSLRDILERCGADESDGSVWFELKEAVFNHNGIQNIDNSLKYVPLLTSIDLTHNAIEQADALSCLTNLKYINLSYNRLTKIPTFSGQICRILQVLVLHNNFIDDIQTLSKLVNLTQLDLRENCLIEHNALIPLSYLAALQMLNLTGNPLYYHPQYRMHTTKYLHINTASVKFVLDDGVLTTTEQRCIGSLHPKYLQQLESHSSSSSQSGGSITSDNSFDRSVKVKPAIINELEDASINIDISTCMTVKSLSDDVVFKEDLSSIHRDYIKSLYDKTGVSPRNVMSSENNSFPQSSTPLQEYIHDAMAKIRSETTNNTTSTHASEASETVTESALDKSDIYDKEPQEIEALSDDDFESGDSNIFMTTIKGEKDVIFAIFGKTHIVERNPITAKVLARISLDSLYLCNEIVEGDVPYVYLEFDTIRNNNCRYYHIQNSEERERFVMRLKKVVESRPPKEAFKVYSCLKCSMKFGVEEQNTVHKGKVECPACGSTLVFEDNS